MSLVVKSVEVTLVDGRVVVVERVAGGIRISAAGLVPVFTSKEAVEIADALMLVARLENQERC